MAFLTGQSWCILKSWYTDGDPEQGFRCCFTDRLNQMYWSVCGTGLINTKLEDFVMLHVLLLAIIVSLVQIIPQYKDSYPVPISLKSANHLFSFLPCVIFCEPGNIEWEDKRKQRCFIMWRTPDEWASLIFKWVRNGKMHEC